ncbi:2-C-methyl-D-erythritol 2,4-cyclodiphosphate synthase [Thalassoroseus pseudoceratinae]|uniref:2-C-methyl-D-erythritol 2,4-cyclodiphosphate synthase n=1 Tax=Thalassoroseus pseudoceratinae TaxID=2713176 RepID=UPI00141F3466|nr:2-C-methyl-D-erythritol 2,4-cyclodiphosphate synthase [Thalassoroseus pseudoceratinae]
MAQLDIRVGFGSDLHRLEEGRPLIIGGIPIKYDKGAVAHSDGDVLLHAAIDALLGAAGLGDIGEWFPNTDDRWKDADSSELLVTTLMTLHERDWHVGNVDCTVSAERPKLSQYKEKIETRLAELLGVEPEAVNVKAKTGEAVGPVGRGEAIAAHVAVLIVRASSGAL